MAFFEVLVYELASFALTDEIIDGDAAVVLFHTEVRSRLAQGNGTTGPSPFPTDRRKAGGRPRRLTSTSGERCSRPRRATTRPQVRLGSSLRLPPIV